MNDLRMIAIPTKVAELVRSTMKAPGYGHPAHREIASGYGPCRLCLKTFREGEEERILFTYDPFHDLAQYPLPGPVFIHAEPCARHEEHAGFPEDLRTHPVTIVAYGAERMVVGKRYIRDGTVEEAAREFLTMRGRNICTSAIRRRVATICGSSARDKHNYRFARSS